jgi:Phage integrase family
LGSTSPLQRSGTWCESGQRVGSFLHPRAGSKDCWGVQRTVQNDLYGCVEDGMRAAGILALNCDDLDFDRKTIRVNKSSDDKTREIRLPKTKNSVATLPMPSALEATLRNYIEHHWQENPSRLLFPSRDGIRPRKRESLVEYGLKPILRKLGIPDKNAGLHAFRHGLATELAEASVPLTVLQQQLRHADVEDDGFECTPTQFQSRSGLRWSTHHFQLVRKCQLVLLDPAKCFPFRRFGTRGGGRTHTTRERQGILRPANPIDSVTLTCYRV